jgi:hypothetical protein
MVATWRRVATGTVLGLLGLLLSGCHVQGTFDVVSENRIAVDLTVSGDVNCPDSLDAIKLTITTVTDGTGGRACHVTGETEAASFTPFGIEVSRAAEYLVLQASLSGSADEWPTSDVQVRFPGQVVSASRGQVAGNVVRITDLGDLALGSGLTVVAIDRPGPATWVVAAAAGVVGGVLATLLVLLAVRRRRRRRPGATAGELVLQPADAPADEVAGESDGAGERDQAGERDRAGESDEPTLALTVPDHAGGAPPEQVDHAWFARPPDPEAATPEATGRPEPAEPPDHSVWAPRDDRG